MKKILISIVFSVLFLSQFSQHAIAQKTDKTVITKILISTEFGEIKLKLYNETPLHRDNFIKLVKEKYFDSTLFHRVINKFMIQGGDPDSKHAADSVLLGDGGPAYTIPAEFRPEIFHKKGVLAAARESDQVNPTKASSGSQFYIVQGKIFTPEELNILAQRLGKTFTEEQIKIYTTIGGTPHLDGNYTVFGEVISGMDVVDKIAIAATDKNNRPLKNIRMMIQIIE